MQISGWSAVLTVRGGPATTTGWVTTRTPGATGRSRTAPGLPPGRGRLTVWHERAESRQLDLELPLTAPLEVPLEITKPRIPKHRNKFGKIYSRRRSGRDYG